MTTKRITLCSTVDDEEIEEYFQAPAEWAICSRCHGNGTHCNPAIDGNGITESEMAELGEDFREGYFAGRYDIQCEECRGTGKILEINEEAFERQQPEIYKRWRKDDREEREYRAMRDSETLWERRMLGCDR